MEKDTETFLSGKKVFYPKLYGKRYGNIFKWEKGILKSSQTKAHGKTKCLPSIEKNTRYSSCCEFLSWRSAKWYFATTKSWLTQSYAFR
jgi:hypothetical protein